MKEIIFFFRDQAGTVGVDDNILALKVTFSPLFQYIYFFNFGGGRILFMYFQLVLSLMTY